MTDLVEKNKNWQKRMEDHKQSRRRDSHGKKVEKHNHALGNNVNSETGDIMWVGCENDDYRDNYERIFGHK